MVAREHVVMKSFAAELIEELEKKGYVIAPSCARFLGEVTSAVRRISRRRSRRGKKGRK